MTSMQQFMAWARGLLSFSGHGGILDRGRLEGKPGSSEHWQDFSLVLYRFDCLRDFA